MIEKKTFEQSQAYLVSALSEILKVRPEEIDTTIAFDRYGVDSASAMKLTGMISSWLGKDLEPTLLFDHPTINKLSEFLVVESGSSDESPVGYALKANHG